MATATVTDVDDFTKDISARHYLTPAIRQQILGKWYNTSGPTKHNPLGFGLDCFEELYPNLLSTDAVSTAALLGDTGSVRKHSSARSVQLALWDMKASWFAGDTFFQGVRWQHIKDRFDYPTSFSLRLPATINSNLPETIDLTTVEMLVFFPGYLRDPFFIYRCLSVGWTLKSMWEVLRTHRGHDTQNFDENVLRLAVESTMCRLTGDKAWKWGMYNQAFPVEKRSKFLDYSSATIATPRAVKQMRFKRTPNADEIEDVRLSDLWQYARSRIPPEAERGTLTRLILAAQAGRVRKMRMSEIRAFMMKSDAHDHFEVVWSHTKDSASAARWNAEFVKRMNEAKIAARQSRRANAQS